MVSHDPKPPKPTNIPPPPTVPPEPFAPRPPISIPKWISDIMPQLDFVLENVLCPGAVQFLAAVQPAILLRDAVVGVLAELYEESTAPSHVKNIRVVIKEMEGVAATSGSRTHKTIVFNAKYIEKLGARTKAEILGVIRHEVVHCFQYNGEGTAPGGLIEGVADFVRLRADLSPPHWKRSEKGERWDEGYEKTGFFLDWLDRTYGPSVVRRINLALGDTQYHEEIFWNDLLGQDIGKLWEQYRHN